MIVPMLALLLADKGPGGLPNGGRCRDSYANVGFLFANNNAKRAIEIDRVIPRDALYKGYPVAYLARTVDGSEYLLTRNPEYIAPAMYSVVSSIFGKTITARDGSLVLPLDQYSKVRLLRFATVEPCVRWPQGIPFPPLA
jgi:hypothetical protein